MKLTSLLAAALLLSACGGHGAVETADTVVLDTPTTTTPPSSTTVTTSRQEPPNQEIDLVTYIAAIEDVLAGTDYEGDALDAPEVFLATGALFCEQLDSGLTADAIMTGYVESLTAGSIEQAGDDDLTMAGVIMGVGVVALCPQHIDAVAGSS